MAWLKPRFRTCIVEPRLKGLVVIKQKRDDDPAVGTLYPWHRVSKAGVVWHAYDVQGDVVQHAGRCLQLQCERDWINHLALRLQRRAFRQMFDDPVWTIVERCNISKLAKWCFMCLGACYAVGSVLFTLKILWVESWLTGGQQIVYYSTSALLASVFCLGAGAICWVGIHDIKSNVRRVRFDSTGVCAAISDGRHVTASWCDLISVKVVGNVVGLRFAVVPILWMLGLKRRSTLLLGIAEERFAIKKPNANAVTRSRAIIQSILIALSCTLLLELAIRQLEYGRGLPLPMLAGVFVAILLSSLLLAVAPRLNSWERKVRLRFRRRASRAAKMRSAM